jgi:hypothetical protein
MSKEKSAIRNLDKRANVMHSLYGFAERKFFDIYKA